MKADVESAVLDLYTEDVYGNADEGSLFNVCRTMDLVLWFIRWMALKM